MTDPSDTSARLTRLTVSNYRSIGENVSIDFEPLTVLVGINGSGKSNLLDAPRFVSHALTDGLEAAVESRHGFDALLRDVGVQRGALRIQLDVEAPSWQATYAVELGSPANRRGEYSVRHEELQVTDPSSGWLGSIAKNSRGMVTVSPTLTGLEKPVRDRRNLVLLAVGGDERLAPVVDALRRIETYALFPETLRHPQPPSQRDYLTKFGENWPSVIRRVMATPAARDLRLAMDRVTGDITDLRAQRLGAGFLVAEFGHARPDGSTKWFEAARESDGTLRVAGILTALVQHPPLTMIGIEEPEQTVHAGVLAVLIDFFDEAARSSQVVLTTHSPELLDRLPVDAIRVVDRIDGTTRVGRLDSGQVNLVRRRLESPGGLLRSQGLVAEQS